MKTPIYFIAGGSHWSLTWDIGTTGIKGKSSLLSITILTFERAISGLWEYNINLVLSRWW
jgi:hypothetical protein